MIVGSTAAKHWWPDFPREPKDLDTMSSDPLPPVHSDDHFYHPALSMESWSLSGMATPNQLYTVKYSHSFWDLPNGSWGKHMADLLFMRQKGCQLDEELFKVLYSIWEETHGSKKMKFKEANAFFGDDAVVRLWQHDSIHSTVAYYDEPLYIQTLAEGHSVKVDSKKMWSMNHDTLVKLFKEEVFATALERILIPSDYKRSPGYAYHWALRRTITSLTKGRSARFIVDHFEEFIKPDCDYLARHLTNKERLIKL